eukprot:9250878-Pyramimonas_sp.AAC.2
MGRGRRRARGGCWLRPRGSISRGEVGVGHRGGALGAALGAARRRPRRRPRRCQAPLLSLEIHLELAWPSPPSSP